ncbi:MAG TPA: alpha-hydroxy acid oxidase [Acetobacteraceae bacterium]|nr:alpha-hydroxy acid oxidase [Acetobacteraceae bacterium]
MPVAVYGYVAHGTETETTLRGNRAAFDAWRLVTRVLVGVEQRSQAIRLFGRHYAAPFGIAPMGGSALVAYQGHTVMAKAARAAGIPFILSANSIIPLEEVAEAYPGAWFAAYQSPNAKAIEGMVARLARAGIAVMVVTADVPIGSNRESDARAGFGFPIRPNLRLGLDVLGHPRWAAAVLARTLLKRGNPHIDDLEPYGGPGLFSRDVAGIAAHEGLNWDHIRLIRRLWHGPLVVKGILSPDDVAVARNAGVDGVILSNHGGRQLDHAVAPLQILARALEQAGDMKVMIDSGFRRGTDIVKALALGAASVFVGRPFLFAAAYAGEAGVAHAIALLAKELDRDMAMLGVRRTGEITRALLVDAHQH